MNRNTSFVVVLILALTVAPQAFSKTRSKRKSLSLGSSQVHHGWSYVRGEWIHSEGYKYVNGKVIRTGPGTPKAAPLPPTEQELRSVASSNRSSGGAPTTDAPNTKATQKARNLTPTSAPQTGSHL